MPRLTLYNADADEDTETYLQSLRDNKLLHTGVNQVNVNNRMNNTLSLETLSSVCPGIVCSGSITRESLKRKEQRSNSSEDEDEFLRNLKMKIDQRGLLHSKENCAPVYDWRDTYSLKKRKGVFSAETDNIVKRFKEAVEQQNSEGLPSTMTHVQPEKFNMNKDAETTRIKAITKNDVQKNNMFTPVNINETNCIDKRVNVMTKKQPLKSDTQRNIIFTPTSLDVNFKNSTNNFFIQMKQTRKDNHVVSSSVNKTTIFETKFQELMYYELMNITPPSGNSSDEDTDIGITNN